ncbi:hypothetical protein [Corynebacterium aquilae]|uniref:Uncharacterized protein n=1 Tax=Corynebacterium aquilae DSM 44791 TaxID=1431546 RepID=A0A1L7CDH9_9CORY|nr:hypothetical protein [Corynebacterium aquilae]APT83920.1 hypothetical protein CAQU_01235 [Corynebacterium aquilae DSM 44791]
MRLTDDNTFKWGFVLMIIGVVVLAIGTAWKWIADGSVPLMFVSLTIVTALNTAVIYTTKKRQPQGH